MQDRFVKETISKEKNVVTKRTPTNFPPTRKDTSPKLQHPTVDPSSFKTGDVLSYVGDDNPMMMTMQNNDDVTTIR